MSCSHAGSRRRPPPGGPEPGGLWLAGDLPGRPRRPMAAAAAVATAVLALAAAAVLAPSAPRPFSQRLEMSFLPVGYGDAIVGIPTTGAPFLVDGGPDPSAARVKKFLRKRHVRRLGLVFSTHHHPDHCGGLPRILERYPCDRIVVNEDPARWMGASDFARLVERGQTPVQVARRGDVFHPGDGISITVLSPGDGAPNDPNARSLVLRVEMSGVAVLLMADADRTTEASLLECCRGSLPSDIMKIAHHGWGSGSGSDFLGAVAPRAAVLTVGPSPYPAPDPLLLKRFAEARVPVWRTDKRGLVSAETDGDFLELRDARANTLMLKKSRAHTGK